MSIKNYGEKSLIKIINAVVNGKELPRFEDYTAIFQAAKRHSLGNFFYFAIKDCEHVLPRLRRNRFRKIIIPTRE